MSSQTVILGGSGVLGHAIWQQAVASPTATVPNSTVPNSTVPNSTVAPPVVTLNTRPLLAALRAGAEDVIHATVAASSGRQNWIYAIGIVDPRAPPAELMDINATGVGLLRRALQRAAQRLGRTPGSVRLVTFGSILEDRPEIAATNPYIHSKAQLHQDFLQARPHPGAAMPVTAWSHIRLHTLYGGRRPQTFMFLGQIEAALRARRPFHMSAGNQIREYHHVDDVAANVLGYLQQASDHAEMIALSSGNAHRLGPFATAVFEHFKLGHLLQIGALAAPPGEVFEAVAVRSRFAVAGRDPALGVIDWFEQLGITRPSV